MLLNPIRKGGEFRSGFFREPPVHTKLADVPFSIPAALSLHTRNGKALCGCTAGCAELKSSGGNLAGFGQPFKGKEAKICVPGKESAGKEHGVLVACRLHLKSSVLMQESASAGWEGMLLYLK